jgi:hypothetical protein
MSFLGSISSAHQLRGDFTKFNQFSPCETIEKVGADIDAALPGLITKLKAAPGSAVVDVELLKKDVGDATTSLKSAGAAFVAAGVCIK